MKKDKILWVDDEIELLRPYIIFLEERNYEVLTAESGQDALDFCKEQHFDIIFLDENMPGLSGLETLLRIKEFDPNVPIVMITKSEEENIMNMAIGNKIADYLIKPVNPNQILLSLKKNIHKNDIISEQKTENYRSDFSKIGMQINESLTFEQWAEVYKKLVYWDLELSETNNDMSDLLSMQKTEANSTFVKFVKKHYASWFENSETRPILSPDLFKKKVFPLLDNGEKVFFILIDNFRLDQWKLIRDKVITPYFSVVDEDVYCSILPTATQYARNA
ncbi:MAG: response regulator, partial [Paludibacteraceae bacterium]|nr:response regulator [Paludibacteraceae bacterium]